MSFFNWLTGTAGYTAILAAFGLAVAAHFFAPRAWSALAWTIAFGVLGAAFVGQREVTASVRIEAAEQAKQRADADEASLHALTSRAMRDAQARVLDDAIARCAAPDADTSPFVVVAELDATGKVVRTWRDGGTALATCVQAQIAGRTLPAPPRAPFLTSFELSFTP